MTEIGITTTVPAEFIYAAGRIPVDLNNIFITHPYREEAIAQAELAGYPRTVCGWIKGLYGIALQEGFKEMVAVTQGDCTQTHALMETLEEEGMRIIPFSYPFAASMDRRRTSLTMEMEQFAQQLGCSWQQAQKEKERLDAARKPVWEIDALTWQENKVTGFENHLWQVSCSDFEGDPEAFADRAEEFIKEARQRPPRPKELRLALIGVPPIIDGIHDYLEELGARVVFNEVPRQFSMPFETGDLVEQYMLYTYPYPVHQRIEDIQAQIELRRVDAVIHYTQSFCFRQIQDILLRKYLPLPFLSLEGDQPGALDARTRLRLETFISILGGN